MSRANNFEVKSGVREVRNNPKYEITTSDVAAFLQKDLNKITTAIRNNGVNVNDIRIKLTTQSLSKKFVMAVLIMPESVLSGSKKLEDVPSVFRGSSDNGGLMIRKDIWAYIKNFCYNNDDRKMFNNPGWRQQVKFKSSQQINALNGFIRPTILNNGGRYVCVAIDLIKVFKAMLRSANGEYEQFSVWVDETDEIENGSHKFIVTKEYHSKDKNGSQIEDAVKRNIAKAVSPVYREHHKR